MEHKECYLAICRWNIADSRIVLKSKNFNFSHYVQETCLKVNVVAVVVTFIPSLSTIQTLYSMYNY